MLGYGVLAGPFYVVASVVEGLVHRDEGFRFTRDDWSLLAAGAHGWVHQGVLVLTGLMVIAAGVGVTRAMSSRWAGRLIAIYGVGLVGAGVFVADGNGDYPVGSTGGDLSSHGVGHLVAAMIGFLAVVAATFVVAAEQSRSGHRSAAVRSRATGVIFLLGFIGVASGSGSAVVVTGFTIAVLVLWAWLAALSVELFRDVLVRDRAAAGDDVSNPASRAASDLAGRPASPPSRLG